MANSKMLKQFIEEVEKQKGIAKIGRSIEVTYTCACEAMTFIQDVLKARSRGGKARAAKLKLSQDPSAIQARIRKQKSREKGARENGK